MDRIGREWQSSLGVLLIMVDYSLHDIGDYGSDEWTG